jgi:hypothetical protein
MPFRPSAIAVGLVCVACSGDGASPEPRIPASLGVVSTPAASTTVGTLAGTLSVSVLDRDDRPLPGIVTTFSVTAGGGRVTPTTDTTNAAGIASTLVTLGTTPGLNQISAVVTGLSPARIDLSAVAGAARTLTLSARLLRFPHDDTSSTVAATMRDSVANVTSGTITWVSRDPTLVSVTSIVNNVGIIDVLRRPGETYVVATSESAADSVRVAVQDAASSPCQFVALPRSLAIGEAIAMDGSHECIRATEPGAEYAIVAHYNTAAVFVTSRATLTGFGIALPADQTAADGPVPAIRASDEQNDFEASLRAREAQLLPARIPAARRWEMARRRLSAVAAVGGISGTARIGDVLQLNVNARDFCDNPTFIGARVVAITQGTVVLADTANPAGGFTPEEYAGFGIAMDTLVRPVDEAAFGTPSDIDANGSVAVLFTKAVNQLTPRGSPGTIVGFYYSRDLLPRASGADACAGSNVAEMFYVIVPDPDARYSDTRTKADVARTTLGTIAHEYQHLINASRRMYITMATQVNEEVWLNEGLSHIAEELVFYRASGRAPRANIDGSQLALGTTLRDLFDRYLLPNVRRYRLYVMAPEATSPFAGDAQLATRGASWSFLRYLADRRGASDGDFWYQLVNSNLVGAPNIDAALAGSSLTARSALADWSVSVLTDDGPVTTSPAFQQPSWNLASVIPSIGESPTFPLATRVLGEGQSTSVILQAGGNAFLRFSVPNQREALLQASAPGNVLPAGLRLTIVRTR